MLLALLLVLGESPSAGVLRQEDTLHGRSTLTYRPLTIGTDRPGSMRTGTIGPDERLPKDVLFGGWTIGSAPRRILPLAWHGETKALWIDLDGDGRFSDKEKWNLGSKPVEIPLTLDQRPRVLLVRLREETPLVAVRGFAEGQVTIEGHRHQVCLLDGDADGCFNTAGTDRVGLDVNRDGKIDPFFEIFPVGSGIEVGGARYLLKTNPTGEVMEVFRRPTETGEVAFTLTRNEKAELKELVFNLVSEWGEWVQVKEVGKFVSLPAGRYRIVDLAFQLEVEPKKRWAYQFFATDPQFGLEVPKREKKTVELLPQLKVDFQLKALIRTQGGAIEGAIVNPWIVASNGLQMTMCERGTLMFRNPEDEKGTFYGRTERAIIRLNGPGSAKLDEQEIGFHCYYLGTLAVRVPAKWKGDKLEVSVTMPTGPLAGDLFGYKELKIEEKK